MNEGTQVQSLSPWVLDFPTLTFLSLFYVFCVSMCTYTCDYVGIHACTCMHRCLKNNQTCLVNSPTCFENLSCMWVYTLLSRKCVSKQFSFLWSLFCFFFSFKLFIWPCLKKGSRKDLSTPHVGGTPLPDKGMPGFPGFKKLRTCTEKIPVMDKHSQCICCLCEGHIQKKCSLCQQL